MGKKALLVGKHGRCWRSKTFDGIEGIDDGGSILDDAPALLTSTRCKKKSSTLSTHYTVAHVRMRIKNKDNPANSSGDI